MFRILARTLTIDEERKNGEYLRIAGSVSVKRGVSSKKQTRECRCEPRFYREGCRSKNTA